MVPLAATADANYSFAGWTGACTGTGACSATMTAARTVGATFAPRRYALTLTRPTHGTITAPGIACGTGGSDCTEAYDFGAVVALTATPDTGYRLRIWTGACTGTGPCSLTMTVARSAGAIFGRAFRGRRRPPEATRAPASTRTQRRAVREARHP